MSDALPASLVRIGDDRATRRRRRLVDPEHEGRGPQPRHRRGRCPRLGTASRRPRRRDPSRIRRPGGRVRDGVGCSRLADQVEAISVAGQQHGMVVLDADRQVIRPAKLWNDTETAPMRDG